jgi:GTP-binding protein EngB required for normal cell division
MSQKLKSFIASSKMKSCTRYINAIDIKYKDETFFLVDTPGFGDT